MTYQVNIIHAATKNVVASHQIETDNASQAVRAIVGVYTVSGGLEKGYEVSARALGGAR